MRNQNNFLDVMLRFVRQGGEVALKNINNSEPGLKADQTIVTKTDRAVSKLAHQMLSKFLKDPAHILVDEEDPGGIDFLDQNLLGKARYVWSVDPIDGTRLYANRIPTFGISIGLIRDLRPWLGVVYFPALRELFYCDGNDSYYVQNAFSPKAKKTKIVPIDQKITSQTTFFCNDTYFRKFNWNDPKFHVLIQACAVVNLLWPTIGRGSGCFHRSSLWDFAGSWPIFRSAGLDLRNYKSGTLLDRLDAKLFNRTPKPWELTEYYLLSSERNFKIIKSKMVQLTVQA